MEIPDSYFSWNGIKGRRLQHDWFILWIDRYFVYHYKLWLKPLRSWAMDFMWIIITKWSEGQQETTPSFK